MSKKHLEKCECGCEEEKCHCDEGEKCCCEDNYSCEDKNEYLELAQRVQAEFDNYRKRSADIVRVARQDGIIDAVVKILPAIDSIEKAKPMIRDKKILEGVELIEKGLKNSLKSLEIEEIESKGQHFDPKYHNVIVVKTDNSLEDGVITDVYQAGYKIRDRIIRYAQVVINKK